MGKKCSVYGCKTGYASQKTDKKLTVYRFPKDPQELQRWIRSIPNQIPMDKITQYMGVCELHFPEGVSKKCFGNHQTPVEPPSIFPNVPSSCCATPQAKPRTTKAALGGVSVRNPDIDEMSQFKTNDTICFDTFYRSLLQRVADLGFLSQDTQRHTLVFISKEREGPVPKYSIYFNVTKVDDVKITRIRYEAYHKLMRIQHPGLKEAITCWSQLDELLHYISKFTLSEETQIHGKFEFILGQIQLLNLPKNSRLYTSDDFYTAFTFFSKSRVLYSHLRNFLQLPSVSTLRKITSLAKNVDDEVLFSSYFSKQEDRSKWCTLILDEIYIKASITYQGGVLFGYAADHPGERATTLLCIMAKCFFTNKKFLVKVLPCHALNAQFLYQTVTTVISSLEKSGAKVFALINDNNRVNQSFFRIFNKMSPATPWMVTSPTNPQQPLFLIFDPVHLLKNIRNNWVTDKTQTLTFYSSDTVKEANWKHLVELHQHEEKTLVRLSKLTKASVAPSNIEKQKVSLVVNVFNDQTAAALRTSSMSNTGWNETADFIDSVIKLWKLMNCKSRWQSIRLRDPDRKAIDNTADGEAARQLLLEWALKAQMMRASKVRMKCLTQDTADALVWTCRCLADISKFLLETSTSIRHTYVCLGFFQQDDLERHFGHFRMSAGANFYLTVQDVYNTHHIDRTKFMLKYTEDDSVDYKHSHHACELCEKNLTQSEVQLLDDLPDEIESVSRDEKSSIYYIAGFIAGKHQEFCATAEVNTEYKEFVDTLNRGGLHYPSISLFKLLLLAYVFFTKTPERLCRNRFVKILQTFPAIFHMDITLDKGAAMRITNVFMKRYACNNTADNKGQDKRKVAKLTSKKQ